MEYVEYLELCGKCTIHCAFQKRSLSNDEMKDLTHITAHDTFLQVRNMQLVKGLGLIAAEIKRQNDENFHTDVNECGNY